MTSSLRYQMRRVSSFFWTGLVIATTEAWVTCNLAGYASDVTRSLPPPRAGCPARRPASTPDGDEVSTGAIATDSREVSTGSGSDRVQRTHDRGSRSRDPVATTTPRGLPARGPRPAPGTDSAA